MGASGQKPDASAGAGATLLRPVQLIRVLLVELMADPLTLSLVVPAVAAAGAFALARHGRRRRRTYQVLAEHREALIAGRGPRLAGLPDPEALRAGFARDRILRVQSLLAPASLAELRRECEANRARAERSYIPGHKKGGTLSYEAVHRQAPACLAFYHAPALHDWLSRVVGERLVPTADHDQSSCSILYYDQAGDHIHWHYDYDFYRGRHFTVLLSLVNRAAQGGPSAGRLQQRHKGGPVVDWDTSENVLILFEGARLLHRASPVTQGDRRVMLSMTYTTDPRVHPLKELARRVKDTAYYGPRALID